MSAARALWGNIGWIAALVVVLVIAGLHWQRQRADHRRRERSSARAELERRFEALVEIEGAVREARDVRVLQEKLNELNQTKARVLKLARGSELTESGLFLAFLQQARSVSEEIEWRLRARSSAGSSTTSE